MPLLIAPKGLSLKVLRITADDKTRKHLETLGLTKDMLLELLSTGAGAAIIKVHDSRISLDHHTALSIMVEPIA